MATESTWDLYRTLLAVIEERSLSAAARKLGLTQPTVGRHIDALEQDLGVALFTRSQLGLAPTETALALRPHAEAMAHSADALRRTASGPADKAEGAVRITASEVIGAEVLPPILATLREAHAGIVVELVLSNRNEDLLRREADIAVRMVRPSQTALVARKIGLVPLAFHAHRRYLGRAGTPATLGALRDHAIIGFDHATPAIHALKAAGLSVDRDDFALRTDSDLAQLAAIRAGFGIGVCQRGIALRDPDLVEVLPGALPLALDMWVTMHSDLRGLARMRVAFDHLATGLAAYVATTRARPSQRE